MDDKLSEEDGQTLQVPKEEEMEVTVSTQLENLIVTSDEADAASNTPTQAEGTGDVLTAAAALPLDVVCKKEDCDDDDSEDSDRYFLHATHSDLTNSMLMVPKQAGY